MGSFGDPVYESGFAGQQSGQPQQHVNGHAPAEEIDLNDPRLVSEALTINPDADAYAIQPPLPDGLWRAKLKQIDVKGPKGELVRFKASKDRNGNVYLFTACESSIIDHSGKWDGIKVTDNFVSTMLRRDGSCHISTILQKLGKPLPQSVNHKSLMDSFLAAVAGEPEAGIETAWEWNCMACDELYDAWVKAGKIGQSNTARRVQGAHRMPAGKDGKPLPEMKCPANPAHGFSVARPRIIRYLGLGELPK